MSRSCHSATSSSAACRLPRSTAREPAELLRLHRVPLVRHRARALLLALAERLLDLAHLGALQVPDLERERLDRRAERRARVHHLGVAVAGEHLRRGHRLAARGARTRTARRTGSTFEYVPTAPDSLPTAIDVARPAQALPIPAHLHAPRARASRRTSSARRGCRACGRPSACRGTRAPGAAIAASSRAAAGDDHVERARHLQRERGVDDVARREAVVDPPAGRRADALLHDVDERGDVVVGDASRVRGPRRRRMPRVRAPSRAARPGRHRARPTPRPRAPRPRATRRSAPRR